MHNIIVGGTSGLGLELARHIPVQDTATVMSRHSTNALDHDRRVEFIPVDLTQPTSIEEAVAAISQGKGFPQLKRIFLTAGKALQGSLSEQSYATLRDMSDTIHIGPMYFFGMLANHLDHPIHVIIIASTSAVKNRKNETAYGSSMAARAQMGIDLWTEWHDSPVLGGSQFTIVYPAGMDTPYWHGTGVDTSTFLDAGDVANIIWKRIDVQESIIGASLVEFTVERENGRPRIFDGPPPRPTL